VFCLHDKKNELLSKSMIEERKNEIAVRNPVIECHAIPLSPEKRKHESDPMGRALWVIVMVMALFKLLLAVILGLFLIRKFPRLMLGTVAGLGGLFWWKKSRQNRVNTSTDAKDQPAPLNA
jgi:hypothetical protein